MDLAKDMKKVNPPKFDGTTLGDKVEAWLTKMKKYIEI